MSHLIPSKLHLRFMEGIKVDKFLLPRRYTLTHSDMTGDLFLTIGSEYDHKKISGWYTRLMRDEVLAEWQVDQETFVLHLFCHVSGGGVVGTAGWRYRIFQQHMPLVLEAFHFGDREIFQTHPKLGASGIVVHFSARQKKYNLVESWGQIGQYRSGG